MAPTPGVTARSVSTTWGAAITAAWSTSAVKGYQFTYLVYGS
jgi:hypothetical protein